MRERHEGHQWDLEKHSKIFEQMPKVHPCYLAIKTLGVTDKT